MDKDSSSGGGVSFCGLLALLFIGLKLTGVIEWPWLWVLTPIWLPVALVSVFLVGGLIVYGFSRRVK